MQGGSEGAFQICSVGESDLDAVWYIKRIGNFQCGMTARWPQSGKPTCNRIAALQSRATTIHKHCALCDGLRALKPSHKAAKSGTAPADCCGKSRARPPAVAADHRICIS